MNSIITQSGAEPFIKKNGVQYFKCNQTGTVFCKALDQSGKVGGEAEAERNNSEANLIRIERIKEITGLELPSVLDYGCGSGNFVECLKSQIGFGYGYDPYSENHFREPRNSYDCITAIEVVEHLAHPFSEFDLMYKLLNKGGKLYIETSFMDFLTEDSDYINPLLGHSCIWSYAGMDMLLSSKGFKIDKVINRNTRIYIK